MKVLRTTVHKSESTEKLSIQIRKQNPTDKIKNEWEGGSAEYGRQTDNQDY